jgi:hypothetical protein
LELKEATFIDASILLELKSTKISRPKTTSLRPYHFSD